MHVHITCVNTCYSHHSNLVVVFTWCSWPPGTLRLTCKLPPIMISKIKTWIKSMLFSECWTSFVRLNSNLKFEFELLNLKYIFLWHLSFQMSYRTLKSDAASSLTIVSKFDPPSSTYDASHSRQVLVTVLWRAHAALYSYIQLFRIIPNI